jgi:hypothetical protein
MTAPSELRAELHLSAEQAQRGGEHVVSAEVIRIQEGLARCITEAFRVAAPVGVADGATLRLPGAGHLLADGSIGDVLVTIRIEKKDLARELRVHPDDLREGCRTELVEVPAGTKDGMTVLVRGAGNRLADGTIGDLFVTVWSDSRLARLGRPKRSFQWRERVVELFFGLLGLYGFIAGFAFPLSEVGEPIVFIDGRFFVLGFGGLLIPVVINLPSAMRPLKGRGLGLALLASVAVLGGIVALIVLLIRTIEGFGYHLKF